MSRRGSRRESDRSSPQSSSFAGAVVTPTSEPQEWAPGGCPPETGWSVESVAISDGVAYIDFAEDSPLIPNASTSGGSMALRVQLDSTAMQFPTVEKAIYSVVGDREAFYHWLQSGVRGHVILDIG